MNAKEILAKLDNLKRNFSKGDKKPIVFFKEGFATTYLGLCGFHSDAFVGLECSVEYKWLTKTLKKLKSREIRLEHVCGKMVITTTDNVISISHEAFTDRSDEYYKKLAPTDEEAFHLTEHDVKTIKESKLFVTKDELRPVMCRTLLSVHGEAVATDARVVFHKPLSNKPISDYITHIVPISECNVRKMVKSNEKGVRGADIFYKYTYLNGDFEIEGALLQKYPDYKRVIVGKRKDFIPLDKDLLIEAIGLFDNSKKEIVGVRIKASKNNLLLHDVDYEGKIYDVRVCIANSDFGYDNLNMVFNKESLLKTLKNCKNEDLWFYFNKSDLEKPSFLVDIANDYTIITFNKK